MIGLKIAVKMARMGPLRRAWFAGTGAVVVLLCVAVPVVAQDGRQAKASRQERDRGTGQA